MRKRNIILVILFVFLIAALPLADGYLFKTKFLHSVKVINEINPHNKITVVDYQLGWFGSTAKLNVMISEKQTLVESNHILPPFVVTVDQTIKHGPYFYDAENNKWTFAFAKIKSNIIIPESYRHSAPPTFHMDMIVSYFYEYITHLTISENKIKTANTYGEITKWDGLSGDFNYKRLKGNLGVVKGNLSIGAYTISSESNNFSLGASTFRFTINGDSLGLVSGKGDWDVSSISFNVKDTPPIFVKDFSLNVNVDLDKNKMLNKVLKFSVKSGVVKGLDIMPSNLIISFNKLDTLNYNNKLSQTTNKDDKTTLLSLFSSGTNVEQTTDINTSSGYLRSTGKIDWPVIPTSIVELQSNYFAKADINVSVSLVNKAIEILFGEAYVTQINPSDSLQTNGVPSEQGLLAQVDSWKAQSLIAVDVAIQLKDLISRKLNSKIFADNIDQYVTKKDLTSELGDKLKNDYMVLHPNVENSDESTSPSPSPAPVTESILSPGALAHKQIDDWIKSGFIKQVNDEYIISFTHP